jgi:hypothetical protein
MLWDISKTLNAMIRLLNIILLVSFLFCYVFGGHDGASGFIWQLEYDYLVQSDFDISVIAIFVFWLPLVGQIILVVVTVKKNYSIKLNMLGLSLLYIVIIPLLILGIGTQNLKTIFTILVFITTTFIFLNKTRTLWK